MDHSISQPTDRDTTLPRTLSVAGAAQRLAVHPNTIRTWTDQGRLPCLRINARGDRRYRIEDLEAFLAHAGRESSYRIAAAEARIAGRSVTGGQTARDRDWPLPPGRAERWGTARTAATGRDDSSARRAAERECIAAIADLAAGAPDLETLLQGIADLTQSHRAP